MEGILFKWTNYYNGWQSRYFVLNDIGVLSYYKSRELIHEGCKGSCLVLACEVKVYPNDSLRFDLIIPGEQFFCLKAKSQSDRQRWLVALGSCKSRGTESMTTVISNNNNNNNTASSMPHVSAIDQELKLKVQELRLYETVLMQRIHAVKSTANDTPTPDAKKLDETTSMLSVTCDAFIHTLDECVKLATGGSTQSLNLLSTTSSINSDKTSTQRKSSKESNVLPKQIVYPTFFSELRHPFSKLSPLSFNDIPSELFLSTCQSYFDLTGKLNSTTFIPFCADANGHINKLRTKMSADSIKFQTLYSIITGEISTQTTKEKYSVIDALLWLKRSIDFLACFLYEFGQGDQSVEDAMNKSYGQTLKGFHGWITREVFSVAFKSVPSNEDFLTSLAIQPNDARGILFERQVLNEMIEHSTHMNIVVKKINDFYIEYKLQSNETFG